MRTRRDNFASPSSSPPSVHFTEMDTAKISATPVQTETLLNIKAGDISDSGTGISGLMGLVSMDSNTSSMKSPVKFTMSAEEVDNFLQIKNDEFALLVLPAMVFLGVLFIIGEKSSYSYMFREFCLSSSPYPHLQFFLYCNSYAAV